MSGINYCTICQKPTDASAAMVSLQKKIAGLDYQGYYASAHYQYNVHPDCIPRLRHLAGDHRNSCPDCDEEEAALREIQALSEKAKSLIMHKLRNPLAIVTGNIDLIKDNQFLPFDVLSKLGVMLEAATRINEELREMLR